MKCVEERRWVRRLVWFSSVFGAWGGAGSAMAMPEGAEVGVSVDFADDLDRPELGLVEWRAKVDNRSSEAVAVRIEWIFDPALGGRSEVEVETGVVEAGRSRPMAGRALPPPPGSLGERPVRTGVVHMTAWPASLAACVEDPRREACRESGRARSALVFLTPQRKFLGNRTSIWVWELATWADYMRQEADRVVATPERDILQFDRSELVRPGTMEPLDLLGEEGKE